MPKAPEVATVNCPECGTTLQDDSNIVSYLGERRADPVEWPPIEVYDDGAYRVRLHTSLRCADKVATRG